MHKLIAFLLILLLGFSHKAEAQYAKETTSNAASLHKKTTHFEKSKKSKEEANHSHKPVYWEKDKTSKPQRYTYTGKKEKRSANKKYTRISEEKRGHMCSTHKTIHKKDSSANETKHTYHESVTSAKKEIEIGKRN